MQRLIATAGAGLVASAAAAQPGVDPADMLHLLVSQSGSSLELAFETPVDGPVDLRRTGERYTGPGSVLNGRGFNAQFGWLASGFFNLPFGSGVFVDAAHVDRGVAFHDAFSFDPILGTGGSPSAWRWSGQMTHNWVSAARPGVYEADLEVYVGDAATGLPLAGWGSASVTLAWELAYLDLGDGPSLVPTRVRPIAAPGTAAVAALGGWALARRRR